ncbi:hypothetical protein [Pseudidiomarina gelatinasegens]|uniref:hypothetical protein n=1 Tax=Pseudidiomarina gelatinasegens TaxID=2487740 RepID=UPI003A97B919
MSIAAAWLAVNAQLITHSRESQLWQVSEAADVHVLHARLPCVQKLEMERQKWCLTPKRLWLLSEVGSKHYVQGFELRESLRRDSSAHHAWLGERLGVYTIDGFILSTYRNRLSADTLIRGFRFRQATRIVSIRELEHGRYHVQLRAPREDVLVIQQADKPTAAPDTIAISMRAERD